MMLTHSLLTAKLLMADYTRKTGMMKDEKTVTYESDQRCIDYSTVSTLCSKTSNFININNNYFESDSWSISQG